MVFNLGLQSTGESTDDEVLCGTPSEPLCCHASVTGEICDGSKRDARHLDSSTLLYSCYLQNTPSMDRIDRIPFDTFTFYVTVTAFKLQPDSTTVLFYICVKV